MFHFEGDEESTKPLPENVSAAILADVRAADESVAGSHSRQSVINTAANVLRLAGIGPPDFQQGHIRFHDI